MSDPESLRSHAERESWISDRAEGAVVSILATPKSGANHVGPVENNELKVRVTAAPADGAANAAIVKVLAEATRIPKSRIEIVAGHASRHKRVLFRGVGAGELKVVLSARNL